MGFSQIIFQKDLKDITRQDLETFFEEQQEETSILEFKEGGTDLKKIHSEIAAFLNTEGGLLILGAPREIDHATKKGYKIAQGPLTPCTVRDKDVISRSIGTGISPAPTTIKIHAVEIEGGAVYLIEVGQSMHPPHQVTDSSKYYMRFEREAKGMPHGLVEAMFFRRQSPVLNIDVTIDPKLSDTDPYLFVNLTFKNLSRNTAHNFGCAVEFIYVSEVYQINKKENIPIMNECAYFEEYWPDKIIVKGMKLTSSFNIMFSGAVAAMIISIYAKDAELETHYYVININGEIVYSEKSKDGTDEPQEDFGRYFAFEQRMAFLSILGLSEKEFQHPNFSVDEKINVLQQKGINIPGSLSAFYSIVNGYKGRLGNLYIELYDIETILNPRNLEFFSEGNYRLIIGGIEHDHLSLHCKNGVITYKLQYRIGSKNFDIPLAQGFWGMLNRLRSHTTASHFNIK